jgi:hypothetical protein
MDEMIAKGRSKPQTLKLVASVSVELQDLLVCSQSKHRTYSIRVWFSRRGRDRRHSHQRALSLAVNGSEHDLQAHSYLAWPS